MSVGGVGNPLVVCRNGDLGYGDVRLGTGIRGGGTGKWVKVGFCELVPDEGVNEIVEGRVGGADPASGEAGVRK